MLKILVGIGSIKERKRLEDLSDDLQSRDRLPGERRRLSSTLLR
jgi:hypothetical protein